VLQHADGQHQEVVEVDRVRGEEPPLVQVVDLRDGLVVERGNAARVLLRADQLVLWGRDLRVDAARDEALRVALQLLEALLREADLVGAVVDGEVQSGSRAAAPRGGGSGRTPRGRSGIQIARNRASEVSSRSRISPAALFVK
jgi:hypothetical protein